MGAPATMVKLTYENQVWNATRRPGKAEDGPPYGPPGMWSTFARHSSLAAAAAGMGNVFTIGDSVRDPDKYRAVGVNARGKVVTTHPVIDARGTIEQ